MADRPALQRRRGSLGHAIAELGLEEDQRVAVELPGLLGRPAGVLGAVGRAAGPRMARFFRILRALAALVQRVLRASDRPEPGAPFWGDTGEDPARQLLSLESHLSPPGKKIDLHGVSNGGIITATGV